MRNPETGWFWLTPLELFLLWRAADLGDPPAVLGVPHVGRSAAARDDLMAQGSAALADRGLGTLDRPDTDLDDLVRLLGARQPGHRTLSLLADRADGRVRAFGAIGGDAAGIVSVADDDVRLGRVWPGTVAAILVDTLDPLPAGAGRVANVAWPVYEQACADGDVGGADAFLATLRAAGLRPPEAHTLLRAVTGRTG
ncbi:MAG TPA: ESX secretion-associated protein EspG, partial [Pseudonocardiaceae bacterium]|nr:ESX secretion-associated protein EspG [Pseudonocardiaceae bacterium]